MEILVVYSLYLGISFAVTIKVGSMLHQHGTVFLTHHLQGNEVLARSINNLLLVGFYLINIGYILIVMNVQGFGFGLESEGQNLPVYLEFLSSRLGVILFSLGTVHFVLLRVLVLWKPRLMPVVQGGK